ncbi:protein SDA1 homolog [Medicago truncatula]|uniref:protein SDA1 homolog n=1 Tax=Medicago truncatula TaxID=3880 RepID=UPI0019681398|nr:protein SDA1 homolog [Medicago truncatula]XP_039689736.1 protein SDA1 homolog [Medicago truncatula]XP_039689737.1 protein SDA1 homolog [Medicago truncatula]XP_039689738.1 protein SDA1 homolog [Medicago truncatula]
MLWVLTYLGTKLMVKSIQFAKRVLVTLWELYQRKVWFDEKTANAICTAMGIKTEALSFLLENKKQIIEIDDSDSDDEPTESPQAIILDKSEKLSSTNFMSCDGKLMVAEALGGRSEKLNLQTLQSKVERDPIGYILEVLLIHSQFNSSLQLFQQAAMNFISVNGIIDSDLTTVASDPTVAEDLAERAMFLTLVAPSYPTLFFLADFPIRLVYLLHSFAQFIPSMSRFKLAHALILLVNRQTVAIDETLPLLMELQTLGDKKLTRFVSQHLVVNIRRLKRPAVIKTQKLQSVMFKMLQEENEAVAKRVLVILWRLYQRKVWFDEKTANAICTASFHPALRWLKRIVMIQTAMMSCLI